MTVDPQWQDVVLLVGNEGAPANSLAFLDQSPRQNTLQPYHSGNTQAAPRWITATPQTCVSFPAIEGHAAYIKTENDLGNAVQFGTGDFCIEGSFAPTFATGAGYIARQMLVTDDGNFSLRLTVTGAGAGNGTTALEATIANVGLEYSLAGPVITHSQWIHAAFYRLGNAFYLAFNGAPTVVGNSANAIALGSAIYIGARPGSPITDAFTGRLASVRVTKGHARYGATLFTPPPWPFATGGLAQTPVIVTPLVARVGEPFAHTITATNEPTSFAATGLPQGLELTNGTITGTPTEHGVFDVEVTATNAEGTSECAAHLVITIPPPVPEITSSLEVTARQGESFHYQIEATNEPLEFTATEMPVGLELDPETGVISGVPTSPAGVWAFPISASNEYGTATATLRLTLEAAVAPTPVPVITSSDTATATVGTSFTYNIEARNFPTSFYATGLPDGLSISTQTGTITGQARQPGTYQVTLSATNAGGTGTMTLTLIVSPAPAERPCPPPPHVPSMAGPDVPAILCYVPDGCCGPLPCDIDEDSFICQIRSLLPEGEPYNNTAEPIAIPAPQYGAITVGCAKVGCEQLILGGCCGQDVIPCQVDPVAPQLAVVDSFGAATYQVVLALCRMLLELDPCTAKQLIRKWAERMGIKHPDSCGPGWSDNVLVFLICFLTQLRYNPSAVNWDFLTYVASRMGAKMVMRYAGDMNGVANSDEPFLSGWWSMARDAQECPPIQPCPPDPRGAEVGGIYDQPRGRMLDTVGCNPPNENSPLSLNIIICPADIIVPDNCNLPVTTSPLPHDREMYLAFWWLLPQLLPRGPLYCLYECCEADCIV